MIRLARLAIARVVAMWCSLATGGMSHEQLLLEEIDRLREAHRSAVGELMRLRGKLEECAGLPDCACRRTVDGGPCG